MLCFTSTVFHKGLSFLPSDTSGRLLCKAESEAGFKDPSVIGQPILPTEQQYVCTYNMCFIPVRTPQQHHCDTHHFQMSLSTIEQILSPEWYKQNIYPTLVAHAHSTHSSVYHAHTFFIVKTPDSRCKTPLNYILLCVDRHLTDRNRVYMITWAIFLIFSYCYCESCIVEICVLFHPSAGSLKLWLTG